MKCDATGSLLVYDAIQSGFARTGTLFAFEQLDITPDILLLAKGLGGGMPLGAFVSSHKIMHSLTYQPALGHITTFGGHPVCCAAALASLQLIIEEKLYQAIPEKSALFKGYLSHLKPVKAIRRKGLMIAIEFEDTDFNFKCIRKCIEKGVIVDWFLFCDTAMRISPPLIITEREIEKACEIIATSIQENQ
jgi:acetylornithine/succinyldiaminopimelate/putrescine aminotransferase